MSLQEPTTLYYVALALLAGVLVFLHRLTGSRFGRAVQALRDDEVRAEALGLPTFVCKLVIFVVAGVVCGIAGGLSVNLQGYVSPNELYWTQSATLMVMVILGGVGTLLGPVIGAGLIKYLENIFSSFNDQILHSVFGFLPSAVEHPLIKVASLFVGEGWELTLGVLFLVLIIFVPGGLMQGIQALQRRLFRSSARIAADATSGAH
jgi:ABC-type branched-subunit amino acid transport system permease subunit